MGKLNVNFYSFWLHSNLQVNEYISLEEDLILSGFFPTDFKGRLSKKIPCIIECNLFMLLFSLKVSDFFSLA